MDNLELFERLGLAIAIGAAVGVERHWREREEREGARTAGIRTFTMFGMLGGVAGLLEHALQKTGGLPGITVGVFLLSLSIVMVVFSIREAIAEQSFSVTSVIAAMLTFGLGALSVLGDLVLASAGGVALVAILAARDFLHAAIRRLQWAELRSAIILLAMTFVLLPVVPDQTIGPFGGVSPRSILVLAILLASISFVGYVAIRLLGPSVGGVVAGAIGGLASSTGTTISFARRSAENPSTSQALAAGAISAGAVSLARTGLLVATLAAPLAAPLLPSIILAAAVMGVYSLVLARRTKADSETQPPANPFELWAVLKMALLLVLVAFAARAAAQFFGDEGLVIASLFSGLADVDAATVTIAGMLPVLTVKAATTGLAAAIVANMVAKAVYGTVSGERSFAMHLWLATVLSGVAALVALPVTGLLQAG
ncbi:MgtC/SapB family protein [Ciceribacter sp. L1K23]|uniref:MgtC/SapB family protein n=1 Tax=Ciceribacter sp. L1K23 TaxID=2820276 RepID=UPI001B81B186|nr:DUF4010 domain-containing protein [Ciceribacter sp. L1K23]MBR0558213.1 MgtC/SapB family protein [Ciceribacter sp. L1K23]